MTWLLITIISYAMFALVSVGDRFLLSGPIPNHKAYTFFIGLLGMLAFLIAPFVDFYLIGPGEFIIGFISGAAFMGALYFLFYGFRMFEVSRMVPATGGLIPIFTLVLSLFFFEERIFGVEDTVAFVLLLSGSILITMEKKWRQTRQSFGTALVASVLFALSFVLAKVVYLAVPFWPAFIWMRVGGFVVAVGLFIFSRELRDLLLVRKKTKPGKTAKTTVLFLGNQAVGAGAGVLQNFAIFLAPPLYVAFINALQGVQYVFLLIFTSFISLKFPRLIHEVFTKKIALQKTIATALIIAGILILSLG